MVTAKLFIGAPLLFPNQVFTSVLFSDGLSAATATQFTASSDNGDFRMVFTGSFTVSGGDITGGTVDSYKLYAGETKVEIGDGYAIDAAALYDAFQNSDTDTIEDLLLNVPAKVTGSKFDDDIRTGEFADTQLGKAGNDRLDGGSGDDVLKGGKGNDALSGDDGFDTLRGGSGDDVFSFFFSSEFPPEGYDKIKDFKPGQDHIALDDFDSFLPPGYLDKAYFHKGKAAATADQVVIYDQKSGKIFYDADGNGAGGQFLLAKVTADTKLHADDFFVYNFGLMSN